VGTSSLNNIRFWLSSHSRPINISPSLSLPLTSRPNLCSRGQNLLRRRIFPNSHFLFCFTQQQFASRLFYYLYTTHTREIRQMASWFTRVPDRRHSVAPSLVSCPLPFFSFNTGNVHCAPYNNGSSCLTWNSAGAIVLVVCQNMSWLSVFVFNLISGRHVVSDNVVAPDINLNFDFVLK
jgi:hypothetical protein